MLLLLVSLWTGAYALDTTLTVDLNDDEARNKEFRRATPVCHVKFILPTGYTLRPQPVRDQYQLYTQFWGWFFI
jgi:hypothetical protein